MVEEKANCEGHFLATWMGTRLASKMGYYLSSSKFRIGKDRGQRNQFFHHLSTGRYCSSAGISGWRVGGEVWYQQCHWGRGETDAITGGDPDGLDGWFPWSTRWRDSLGSILQNNMEVIFNTVTGQGWLDGWAKYWHHRGINTSSSKMEIVRQKVFSHVTLMTFAFVCALKDTWLR